MIEQQLKRSLGQAMHGVQVDRVMQVSFEESRW